MCVNRAVENVVGKYVYMLCVVDVYDAPVMMVLFAISSTKNLFKWIILLRIILHY